MNESGEQVEVKRQRAPFTMVRKAVLEDESLTAAHKMVYVALCYFADYETGELTAHRKTIADIASCDVRTVDRALQKLENQGYVDIERRQSTGKYRLANIYTLLNFWEKSPRPKTSDTVDRRGGTGSPPEKDEDLGGGTGSLPRGTESQSLNKNEVNKKKGGGDALDPRDAPATEKAPPDPPPHGDNSRPFGVLPAMADIAKDAGKPWTIYAEDRKNIETAVAVHGGESVVSAWRQHLADGGSAKLRIFLEDATYPKPKPKPLPAAICEDCGREVSRGAVADWDGEDLCIECFKKRQAETMTASKVRGGSLPSFFKAWSSLRSEMGDTCNEKEALLHAGEAVTTTPPEAGN